MDFNSHALFSIRALIFYNTKTKTKPKQLLNRPTHLHFRFISVLINLLNTTLRSSSYLALFLPLRLFLLQRPPAP